MDATIDPVEVTIKKCFKNSEENGKGTISLPVFYKEYFFDSRVHHGSV
jgi:hypothetical protein